MVGRRGQPVVRPTRSLECWWTFGPVSQLLIRLEMAHHLAFRVQTIINHFCTVIERLALLSHLEGTAAFSEALHMLTRCVLTSTSFSSVVSACICWALEKKRQS